MKTYENDNGLFVDKSTDPPTACGYLFDFAGHGIFSPGGRVKISEEDADTHNKLLADAEWTAMLKHGAGVLYLTKGTDGITWYASDWPSVHKVPIRGRRTSFHNMAGRNGRTDVWFHLDGAEWHGVNIGDNQILRVKRNKTEKAVTWKSLVGRG